MEDNILTVAQEMDAFQEDFQKTAIECQKFCFATRAKEFQVQAREKLQALSARAHLLKRRAIACQFEEGANAMLSYQETVNALINELSMWIALKDDDPSSAWDYLVNAQMATISAMQAHSLASHLESYSEHLFVLEKHTFPPQMFCSPGMIIKEARCSICDAEYGDCDHIAGKPYMGELCSRLILHVDLEEFSLVDKPANKHARIISFTDDKGCKIRSRIQHKFRFWHRTLLAHGWWASPPSVSQQRAVRHNWVGHNHIECVLCAKPQRC